MKFKLKAYSIWEFGKRVDANGNPHQEDSLFPAHGEQQDSDRLFVLCDGMGGHDAGEVASATVCEAMGRSVMASVPDSEALFTDDMLQKAVADAFEALDAHDNGAVKKMGTTMTFLKLHAGGATIAHMGDSRVYHIRPGKDAAETQILFCTEDHSLVNDLVKVGELTPGEARLSPQKNIITRAMQPHMERRPRADVKHITDIRPGDYFYMCSDGMLEQMEDDNICFNFSAMTGDDPNKVRVLTEATHYNHDNHTAFIIHILDVEGKPEPLEEKDERKPVPETTALPPLPKAKAEDGDDERFVVEAEDGDEEQEPTFVDNNEATAMPQMAGQTGGRNVTDPYRGMKGQRGQGKKSGLDKFLSDSKNLYLFGTIIVFVLALGCIFIPKMKKDTRKHNGVEMRDTRRHSDRNSDTSGPGKTTRRSEATQTNEGKDNETSVQNGTPLKEDKTNPLKDGKQQTAPGKVTDNPAKTDGASNRPDGSLKPSGSHVNPSDSHKPSDSSKSGKQGKVKPENKPNKEEGDSEEHLQSA